MYELFDIGAQPTQDRARAPRCGHPHGRRRDGSNFDLNKDQIAREKDKITQDKQKVLAKFK